MRCRATYQLCRNVCCCTRSCRECRRILLFLRMGGFGVYNRTRTQRSTLADLRTHTREMHAALFRMKDSSTLHPMPSLIKLRKPIPKVELGSKCIPSANSSSSHRQGVVQFRTQLQIHDVMFRDPWLLQQSQLEGLNVGFRVSQILLLSLCSREFSNARAFCKQMKHEAASNFGTVRT